MTGRILFNTATNYRQYTVILTKVRIHLTLCHQTQLHLSRHPDKSQDPSRPIPSNSPAPQPSS
ncbi:hypothetical protein, partial [Pseudoalteromonas sp. Of7M-16]|uniref:hypothetical protein n=1 Tax=Pseudoalteromonas sp. Of7M-16 TaxID=2917756 RepID=UPI001EF57F0C